MKRLIYILVVVLLVVLVSGCTSNESSKTFSGNNVTFQYPGTWEENNLTKDYMANVGNDTESFSLFSINTTYGGINVGNSTLSKMVRNYKLANLTTEKTLTVDGVNATLLSSPDKIRTRSIALWIKGDKFFQAEYNSQDSSTATFEKILSTIKST